MGTPAVGAKRASTFHQIGLTNFVACNEPVFQPPVRRPQQQQEECPVSLVFGRGSAAFRTPYHNLPFGRAHAPPPGPASLLQGHFENRKLIGHGNRFKAGSISVSFHLVAGSKLTARETKKLNKTGRAGIRIMPLSSGWCREAMHASSKRLFET
jgi:hypothetical protein